MNDLISGLLHTCSQRLLEPKLHRLCNREATIFMTSLFDTDRWINIMEILPHDCDTNTSVANPNPLHTVWLQWPMAIAALGYSGPTKRMIYIVRGRDGGLLQFCKGEAVKMTTCHQISFVSKIHNSLAMVNETHLWPWHRHSIYGTLTSNTPGLGFDVIGNLEYMLQMILFI